MSLPSRHDHLRIVVGHVVDIGFRQPLRRQVLGDGARDIVLAGDEVVVIGHDVAPVAGVTGRRGEDRRESVEHVAELGVEVSMPGFCSLMNAWVSARNSCWRAIGNDTSPGKRRISSGAVTKLACEALTATCWRPSQLRRGSVMPGQRRGIDIVDHFDGRRGRSEAVARGGDGHRARLADGAG